MITILVFRKIAANDSLRLVLKFHKQYKYPQDWKTTNYFYNFEVRHPRCVEPNLLNGKSTVKTQLYLLAMSGWIT